MDGRPPGPGHPKRSRPKKHVGGHKTPRQTDADTELEMAKDRTKDSSGPGKSKSLLAHLKEESVDAGKDAAGSDAAACRKDPQASGQDDLPDIRHLFELLGFDRGGDWNALFIDGDDKDNDEDCDEDEDDEYDEYDEYDYYPYPVFCKIIEGVSRELADVSLFAWSDFMEDVEDGRLGGPSSWTFLELSQEELDILGGEAAIDAFRSRLARDLRRLGIKRSPSTLPHDLWMIMVRLYMIREWKRKAKMEKKKPAVPPRLLDSLLENWDRDAILDIHMGQLKVMVGMAFDTCMDHREKFPYKEAVLDRHVHFKGVDIGGPAKSRPKKS